MAINIYFDLGKYQSGFDESVAVFTTAVVLAMGFATLSLSNFPPVTLFGLLSALVMLLALVSRFIVIPFMLNPGYLNLKVPWQK